MERIENRENEKKKYVYLVFGLFLLMAMVTGATYAYFALTASNNNTITGNVGGTTLSLTVTKRFPTANTNMIPQLESTLGEAISDTYSCVDDNGNVVCQVYQATVRNTGTTSAELEGVISFQNIDTLPNLKWARIEAERTMGTYTSYPATTSEALFEMGKVLAPNASASYYFVIWIDEIGVVQTDQGTFRATINFRSGGEAGGITSTIRPGGTLATQFMQNLYNDGGVLTTTNIGGNSANPSVSLNSAQKIMLDNNGEYRYYGTTPNNYVEFNGEEWRIIGVSNVKSSESDTTGSLRMKLIRESSIGNYSWDSSASDINDGNGVNNWNLSDIHNELNTLYLNQQSGTCYTSMNDFSAACDFTGIGLNASARSMIDDAVWYLGGLDDFSNANLSLIYTAERGTTVHSCTDPGNDFNNPAEDDGGCPRPTVGVDKVGLMYPSDYGYASDLSSCTLSLESYNNEACYNWLSNGDRQWMISPYVSVGTGSAAASKAPIIFSDNRIIANSSVANAAGIRPVVYLKSTVKIMDGEGTSGNPYKLGM